MSKMAKYLSKRLTFLTWEVGVESCIGISKVWSDSFFVSITITSAFKLILLDRLLDEKSNSNDSSFSI